MDENADTVEDKSTREADDELSDEELSEVSGGETPTESISFNYGGIKWSY